MKRIINTSLIYFFVILTVLCGVQICPQKVFAEQDFPQGNEYAYYKYKGEVAHFFTHEIVNDPKKAFSGKLSHHFDKDCITHTEFKNFLTEMYNNNFCLVDIFDVVGISDGKAYFKDLFVPFGKKPFMLSFDDMSYDSTNLGQSDKIILDDNGNFASFTKNNSPQVEYDKEAICIMEDFIASHPDFSCRNARAVLCPTGYDGILGYRINIDGTNRDEELEKIAPLVSKLKKLNYHFGCHTYGHIQVEYSSYSTLCRDLKRYRDEIIPTINSTPIFCFPCGSKVMSGNKLELLKQFGYKIFFCVGDATTQEKNGCVFLKREVLNGVALRNYRKEYSKFFDTKKVYDHENRTIKFPN